MMYVDFKAGEKEYKLRLNTRNIVTLEKQIGCNALLIFGMDDKNPRVPTTGEMVAVLHASLQQYQHGITLDGAYEIFDDFIADGNSPTNFLTVIVDIYRVSGLMPEVKQGETEKN